MRKSLLAFLTIILAVVLAACGSSDKGSDSKKGSDAAGESKSIKLGATAGPYSDMLKKAIIPQLEEKGYKVELVEFSDYVQPNKALDNGDIDANLFQHTKYLENFEEQNNMDLEALIIVPTAPMGFFSNKYKSIDEIPDGATVAIANDPSNAARTLLSLQEQGLIEIDPSIEELKASEKDVVKNDKNLVFQPIEAAALPRTVESVDLAGVPGNFALAAGLDLLNAVFLENMPDQFRNVIAVKADNKDSQLSKDLVEIVESAKFEEVIDAEFKGFGKPEWMEKRK
ncbi:MULTISPECIES: MetQ/NlpA family ABC transporter substrate-binding protein [unclassified Lysinibacillus]|uniref:MetQ/NlpA family ABC transporter substrate-binding protein n=1 Tax=unclassified Lysinibacillus TaxID=2636778 RepID=UPI003806DE45